MITGVGHFRRCGSPAVSMRRVDPLLGTCSLTELRQRRSHKWRNYPPGVLPAFVAEMDFDLAGPITAAVTSALAIGDCGYGHIGQLPDAFAFAGEIPRTSVGKFLKLKLRQQYADWKWE